MQIIYSIFISKTIAYFVNYKKLYAMQFNRDHSANSADLENQ